MLINEILKSRDALYIFFAKTPSIETFSRLLAHREHYQLDLQIIFRDEITDNRKLKLLESIIKLGSEVYYLSAFGLFPKNIKSFAVIDFERTYDLNLNWPDSDQDKVKLLSNTFYQLRGNSELISKEYSYKYPVINFYASNLEVFSGSEVEYFWQVDNLPAKSKCYLWVNNQPVELTIIN